MTTTNAIPTLQIDRTTLKVYRHPGDIYALLEGPRGGVTHVLPADQIGMVWASTGGTYKGRWFAPFGPRGLRVLDLHEAAWRFHGAKHRALAAVMSVYDEQGSIDELRAVMLIQPDPRVCHLDADSLRRAVASLLA